MKRKSKVITLDKAIAQVSSGQTIAVGGLGLHNAPMALVRALIRTGVNKLTWVPGKASIDADLPIGAGIVNKIASPCISFEWLSGLGPCTRNCLEKGIPHHIDIWECDEGIFQSALLASAYGLPYFHTFSGLGTDIPSVNNDIEVAESPFSGSKIINVPPLIPDIAFIHAQSSDLYGNLRFEGMLGWDILYAKSAKLVIASVESLVLQDDFNNDPRQVVLDGRYVDSVVHIPFGAHPLSSHGYYDLDAAHLTEYLNQANSFRKTGDKNYLQEYLDKYVFGPSSHEEYIELVGGVKKIFQLSSAEPKHKENKSEKDAFSKSELIAILLSRELKNGEVVGFGISSEIPMAACRVAQFTHAPDMVFSNGDSCFITNVIDKNTSINHSSAQYEFIKSAEARVDATSFLFEHRPKKTDVFFSSGMQLDKYGNQNLVAIGNYEKPFVRGIGPVGAATVTPYVKKMFLYLEQQTKHNLIEKVDFVSAPGYVDGPDGRKKAGLPQEGGPTLLITDRAVFDFDKNNKQMRLKHLLPGESIESVLSNMGFKPLISDNVSIVDPPTSEELYILREVVDLRGILRN